METLKRTFALMAYSDLESDESSKDPHSDAKLQVMANEAESLSFESVVLSSSE